MSFAWIAIPVLLLFAGSQIYWWGKLYAAIARITSARTWRWVLRGAALGVYLLLFALNLGLFGRRPSSIRLTLYDAVVEAPLVCWVICSLVSFLIVILFWLARQAARPFARQSDPEPALASPGRRQFLERTGSVFAAAPFVAGAYGLFYGRLNLEVTRQPIRLQRLPKAFDGFRIAQLSDIHIGPFTPEELIRQYVAIVNELKPDLIALTGDFVTWDAATQQAVVSALAGLHAPYGIFGCLGNHEAWSRTEDSITLLFRQIGIPILRQSQAQVQANGESLNLIGVDYRSKRNTPGPPSEHYVNEYLEGVDRLVAPGKVNILLSHNPNTYDRAAALGIDLSLAGHTHGGQVALEFISPEIAPSRLVTPYVAGWFQKPGGQLYVNRGIGTIGVPMRIGARPEITVFELVRPV